MPPRLALSLLLFCVGSAVALPARSADVVSVYGLELEVDDERERLLIFADAPLEARLIEVDERTFMLALPGSALDASAPTRIQPVVQGTVVRVTAFDRADPNADPEVRIVVQRRPGEPPSIERRASVIAVDLEPLQRPSRASEETISVKYRRAQTKRVIDDIAKATGETLIYDDAVTGLGALTIEGPGKVTRAEALVLLDSVLLLKGFAAIPAPGGGRKLVPISGAPSPWSPSGELENSDAPVTTLLRLESADAVDMVTAITPYLGSYTTAVAFEPTNSLILAGPGSRLRRLRTVIEALDDIEFGVPVFWRLDHADAETIARQLEEILGPREVRYAAGDARTNTLLLRVRAESLSRARALVDRLDRPGRARGELHVIRVRYADPAALAEQLTALRDDTPPTYAETLAGRGGLRGQDFHVVAEPATRSLLVRADPASFGPVFDTVRELDRMPPSVRIEVMVASLVLGDQLDIGLDYLVPTITDVKAPDDLITSVTSNPSGGGIQQLPSSERPFVASFSRAPLFLPIVDPLSGNTFLVGPIPRESASLTMNEREIRTETLMRPQLLVVSGEEHEVFAGSNVPVRVARSEDVGSAVEVRQNIERYDVGTSLRVTPTVGSEGAVTLDLSIVVSSLAESQAGPVERVGPTIREIEIQSTIRLRHGEVAVIASETQPVSQRRVTGVPWLKDIPFLGVLFRSTNEESARRILLVTAQAEILRPEVRELARELAERLGPLEAEER